MWCKEGLNKGGGLKGGHAGSAEVIFRTLPCWWIAQLVCGGGWRLGLGRCACSAGRAVKVDDPLGVLWACWVVGLGLPVPKVLQFTWCGEGVQLSLGVQLSCDSRITAGNSFIKQQVESTVNAACA